MKAWINQIFRSKIAKRGGVARRKVSSIDRYASRDSVTAACRRRGYNIVEHGDQWLISRDKANVRLIQ